MGMIGEVYPNPANTQVSLNYFLGEASQAVVSVSSTTGHVLYQEKVNTSTGTLHINTSNLSNGMYLLKVQSNNGAAAMKKLMILH
jgi:predicted neuraminidase